MVQENGYLDVDEITLDRHADWDVALVTVVSDAELQMGLHNYYQKYSFLLRQDNHLATLHFCLLWILYLMQQLPSLDQFIIQSDCAFQRAHCFLFPSQLQQTLRMAEVELRAQRTESQAVLKLFQRQLEVFTVKKCYSTHVVNARNPETEVLIFLLKRVSVEVVFKGQNVVIQRTMAVTPIGQDAPIIRLEGESLAEQGDCLLKLPLLEEVGAHVVVGQCNLHQQFGFQSFVFEGFVSQFQIGQCLLIVLLQAVQIGAQNQKFSVVRVHFKCPLHLQSTLIQLFFYQVILALLVQLLQLGTYHLHEQSYLRVPLSNLISFPHQKTSLRILLHTPAQQGAQDQQIHVSPVLSKAHLQLIHGQSSLINLKVSQATLEMSPEKMIFPCFFEYFSLESRVSFDEKFVLSLHENVLHTTYLQQLESQYFTQVPNFFLPNGG